MILLFNDSLVRKAIGLVELGPPGPHKRENMVKNDGYASALMNEGILSLMGRSKFR